MQPKLTHKQYQAIDLLASGTPVRYIAEVLQIRRETLWRWRQMPEFQRVQHERQQLLHLEMKEQVLEVMRLALASVTRDLKQAEDPTRYNPLATALDVLKLLHPSPRSGWT